jgi:hypothetical protein
VLHQSCSTRLGEIGAFGRRNKTVNAFQAGWHKGIRGFLLGFRVNAHGSALEDKFLTELALGVESAYSFRLRRIVLLKLDIGEAANYSRGL